MFSLPKSSSKNVRDKVWECPVFVLLEPDIRGGVGGSDHVQWHSRRGFWWASSLTSRALDKNRNLQWAKRETERVTDLSTTTFSAQHTQFHEHSWAGNQHLIAEQGDRARWPRKFPVEEAETVLKLNNINRRFSTASALLVFLSVSSYVFILLISSSVCLHPSSADTLFPSLQCTSLDTLFLTLVCTSHFSWYFTV